MRVSLGRRAVSSSRARADCAPDNSVEERADVVGVEGRAGEGVALDHLREQGGLAGLERHHLLLDGAGRDEAVDQYRLVLADAVGAVDGLRLDGGVPPRVE